MKKLKENSGLISLIISSITLIIAVVLSVLFIVNMNKKEKPYDQFRMYVGTNDKDTFEPMEQAKAKGIVDSICLTYFSDGFTLTEATGAWKNEDQSVTHEYTLVVYVSGVTIDVVHQAADKMILDLNQSSILIESYSVPVEFYSGKNS